MKKRNKGYEDFLITFFVNDRVHRVPLSELALHQDDPFFIQSLGFSKNFRLPFKITGNSERTEYYIKPTKTRGFRAYIQRSPIREHKLEAGDYITFKNFADQSFKILVSALSGSKLAYTKYELPEHSEITVGRKPTNGIFYDKTNYLSREGHFVIRTERTGQALVEDKKESVGLYVNGVRTKRHVLKPFDEIFIMGLSIVYLGNALALSDGAESYQLAQTRAFTKKEPGYRESEPFVRTPRVMKTITPSEVEIDPPPNPPVQDNTPAFLRLGPGLTTAIIMIVGVLITVMSYAGGLQGVAISGIVMTIGLVAGTLIWPTLTRNYQQKNVAEQENIRRTKYLNYIDSIEKDLERKRHRTTKLLHTRLNPSPDILCSLLDSRKNKLHLWERSAEDNDFLDVRLGVGEREFEVSLKTPKKTIQITDDYLADLPEKLTRKYSVLRDVPITLNLNENLTVGMIGGRVEMEKLLEEIILNIIALHSYDEVKLVFIASPKDMKKFEDYKDLPHTWSNDKSVRFLATNTDEVHHIFTHIDDLIKERTEKGEAGAPVPHFVMIITEPTLIEKEALLRYMYSNDPRYALTSIFAYGDITKLPKACSTIIECDIERMGYYSKNEESEFRRFTPDILDEKRISRFARGLSKLPIKRELTSMSIPQNISFLEMYKVGNVEDLNIRRNWEENPSSRSLAAPVGQMAGGETFALDIHESYQGCHGLVAGTTGSGKSEFLQEYILSLAVNYSPEEVAFVLVDFKGGDMARPFMKKADSPALPHLSAAISNLSENTLYRALVSFDSEIKYRQNVFNKAALKLGVDKLDINSYHRYFEEGRLDIALPHLVIIIDEFAQLKTQKPEFLDRLIDVAQVGRSLGIHLILATQKPSGLVDAQIWSNSRFRICLRVADKQDSIDMINKPDSALIRNPGRFYIQVGADELFQCVQSGYSGVDYNPMDHYIADEDLTVHLIDSSASVIESAKLTSKQSVSGLTQLEAVVTEIIDVGEEMDLRAEPLWLEELPAKITVEETGNAVGIMDLLRSRKQEPLDIDLENGHYAIYGASGSGKTTFLHTLVYSLIKKGMRPDELNIYALDFGGRNLGYLEKLPHTGAVVYADQRAEIEEVLSILQSTIEKRKRLFGASRCGSYHEYIQSGEKLPNILVLIDNYGALHEKYPDLSDRIVELVSFGSTFGVNFVLTGNTVNGIYYRVAEHISNRIALQMNDPGNYYDIFGMRPEILPGDNVGRGLVAYGKQIVEFQTALPVSHATEAERILALSDEYKLLDSIWKGERPVGLITDEPVEDDSEVSFYESNNEMDEKTQEIPQVELDPYQAFKLGILVRNERQLEKQYDELLSDLEDERVVMIDTDQRRYEKLTERYSNVSYLSSTEEIDDFFENLKPELNDRLEKITDEKLFFIVSDYSQVFSVLTDDEADFLRKVVKYIDAPEYGIHFITGYNVQSPGNSDVLFNTLLTRADTFLLDKSTYDRASENIDSLPVVEAYDPSRVYILKSEVDE